MSCWYDIVAFIFFLITAILCALYLIKNNHVRSKSNHVMKSYKDLMKKSEE